MKYAYLSTFHPYRGGIAQFNAALYREIEKHHEIKAFNFTRQYPSILFPGKTQMVTQDDDADAIPNERLLDTLNPFSYLTTANKIKRYQPDVLVTKFWMPFFAPALGTVAKKLRKTGCKTVAVLDNVIPHEKRLGDNALIRYFLSAYDGYIAMSEQVKQDLLLLKPNAQYLHHEHPLYNHFPAPIAKNEARQKLGIDPAKKILLYFGFIREYKGLDLLIKQLALLPPDYELIVAGEPYGSFQPYLDLIDELNLHERVHLHVRYISDHEVPLFYSAADVCMLTYKSATQSGIVAIAFHYQLPVIVTRVGGLPDLVEKPETGLVVDRPDPHLIAESVQEYFADTRFKEDVFVQNIKALKQRLSWNSLYNSLDKLVVELM